MKQTVDPSGNGCVVAEQLAPVFDWPIGGQDRGGSFVAAHDDFEQILGGGVRQFPHAEIIDNEERCGRGALDVLLPLAGDLRLGLT